MMAGNDSNVTHALFPPAAAININHLGLSTKSCFDRKMKLAKLLADRNVFVSISEIHVSSARAQDVFFRPCFFPSCYL